MYIIHRRYLCWSYPCKRSHYFLDECQRNRQVSSLDHSKSYFLPYTVFCLSFQVLNQRLNTESLLYFAISSALLITLTQIWALLPLSHAKRDSLLMIIKFPSNLLSQIIEKLLHHMLNAMVAEQTMLFCIHISCLTIQQLFYMILPRFSEQKTKRTTM